MKVAVTSQRPDLKGRIAPRFGRARYFLIVDTASGEFSVRNNMGHLNTAHTAGMQVAGAIVSLQVHAVITRRIGPKAFATLRAANVTVYTVAAGAVADAIEKLKRGQLQPAQEPNMQEHST